MMKFLIVVLAVVAAAHAQNRGFSGFQNQQKSRNQIPFQSQRYQPQKFQPYKPFVASTVKPPPARSTFFAPTSFRTTTAAPLLISPTPYVPTNPKYYNTDARSAVVLKEGSQIEPDGTYNWFFETNNGIAAQAQGIPRTLPGNPPQVAETAQGSFSWRAPNGENINFVYVADENGYQPRSDAIPTSPPIPPLILRALEYNARFNPTK